MKKQQKTYILLIAVLVIWGIIGYQIYIRLNPPAPELNIAKLNTNFVRQQTIQSSFYELKTSYRDPFLGGFPKKKRIVKKKKVIPKAKPTIPFPNVVYNGIIEGNSSTAYILTINGRQEIVKLGQEVQKITLTKATKKEVVVQFEGISKTILSKQ